ncbi:MAG: class I SAM-dependent methyltransferase [Pseudomonadota bacterium]
MGWRKTVAVGAIKNVIPFKPQIRSLKRQITGYAPNPSNMATTIADCERILSALERQDRSIDGITGLEIGSGWFPTIPLIMRLLGAQKYYLTDINPYLDGVTYAATCRYLLENIEALATRFGFDPDQAREKIAQWTTIEEAGLTYLCPFNIADVPDDALDLITSRTVLEHIPPQDLTALHAALKPKLKSAGLAVHVVDESDHFEHADHSISRVHFLTMSSAAWGFANWAYDYQNRLRHHQFNPLFESAGYTVLDETAVVHEDTRDAVPTLDLKPPFDAMTAEQIAVLTSVFVLAPA